MSLFSGFSLDQWRLERAAQDALLNWTWWAEDYSHSGSFATMPVFQTYPRFRGFGADYSVFRGLNAHETDRLRQWFQKLPDPKSFDDLYERFMAASMGQKRISLVSKLLTLWKPQDYAMWDQLARNGLKRIHGSQRGHCYSQHNPQSYAVFRDDFFDLFAAVEDDLVATAAKLNLDANSADFAPRILDNYLLLVGNE